jgi:hypothetical protein
MVIDPLIEEPLAVGLGCDLEEMLVESTVTSTPNINSERTRPGEQHIAISDYIVGWNSGGAPVCSCRFPFL